jgi:hypothetical protein
MLEFLLPLRVRKKQTERLARIGHGPGSARERMLLCSALRKSQVKSVMAAKNFGEWMARRAGTSGRRAMFTIRYTKTKRRTGT